MVFGPRFQTDHISCEGFSWLTIDPKPNLAATKTLVRITMTKVRISMAQTMMSTVLIMRKVSACWLTQNGSDRARQLKVPAAAHSASSALHPTEWGSRTRASFLKVSLFIKLALSWEQVTTKLWMSLVTIGHQWATKSHAGARSSTEEQPLKPPQASNLSATNPCHILPHCRFNFHARTRRIACTCVPYIGNKSSSGGSGNALEGWSLTWCCNRGPGRVV